MPAASSHVRLRTAGVSPMTNDQNARSHIARLLLFSSTAKAGDLPASIDLVEVSALVSC
jgi:hypothetical protein